MFTRLQIALQFPDELIKDSVRVYQAIQSKLPDVQLQILGDTSHGSCCVDEVAAAHVNADCVIHYGRACMSPYVFVNETARSSLTVLQNTSFVCLLCVYTSTLRRGCARLSTCSNLWFFTRGIAARTCLLRCGVPSRHTESKRTMSFDSFSA